MEQLAWLLDGAIRIPGTQIRFGLDSIIGLIPVAGDVAGVALGATILYEGVRIGAPGPLLAKMVGNSVADGVLGVVPVVGDLADFAFKSNRRNAKLLMDHLDALDGIERRATWASTAKAALVAAVFIGAAAGLVWVGWKVVSAVFGLIRNAM